MQVRKHLSNLVTFQKVFFCFTFQNLKNFNQNPIQIETGWLFGSLNGYKPGNTIQCVSVRTAANIQREVLTVSLCAARPSAPGQRALLQVWCCNIKEQTEAVEHRILWTEEEPPWAHQCVGRELHSSSAPGNVSQQVQVCRNDTTSHTTRDAGRRLHWRRCCDSNLCRMSQ